jgi:prepilin-type processing-associated H-X9-DG protein
LPAFEIAVRVLLLGALLVVAVPSCNGARKEAYKVQCQSNLRHLFAAAMSYAGGPEAGLFPFVDGDREPRAHKSLNELLAFDYEGMSPWLFVCPVGEAVAAETAPDGSFVLEATNLDYSWVATRTSKVVSRPLCSDKYIDGYRDAAGSHRGHPGGMNVLYTDCRVAWIPDEQLPPETMLPGGLTR